MANIPLEVFSEIHATAKEIISLIENTKPYSITYEETKELIEDLSSKSHTISDKLKIFHNVVEHWHQINIRVKTNKEIK